MVVAFAQIVLAVVLVLSAIGGTFAVTHVRGTRGRLGASDHRTGR